ncbi:MAG: hypothetical protein JWQ74_3214 [Marmoricola sp.]|nr:hypothetical protein [Marmoricola sp.]
MDMLVTGWATNTSTGGEHPAHQVVSAGTDTQDRPVYESLCGQVRGASGWMQAGPGVTRCQACQEQAAGSPD